MLIAAVDPGKTTGVATWDTTTGEHWSTEYGTDAFMEWLRKTAAADLYRRGAYPLSDQRPVQLVSESFVITPQTGKNSQAAWSLELIGAMKYVVAEYLLPQLVLQSPAAGKSFGTDAKLRHMGMWKPGLAGHANDASRHLLTYLVTRAKVFDTARLMELAAL